MKVEDLLNTWLTNHQTIAAKATALGTKAFIIIDNKGGLKIEELNVFRRIKRIILNLINEINGQIGNPVARSLDEINFEALNDVLEKVPDNQKANFDLFIERVKKLKYKEEKLLNQILNNNQNFETLSFTKQKQIIKFLLEQPKIKNAFEFFKKGDTRDQIAQMKDFLKSYSYVISGIDLKNALQNSQLHANFEEYLKQEFSSENLSFVDTIKEFEFEVRKGEENKNCVLKKAKSIFESYIKENAVSQINLPSKTRILIEQIMAKQNPSWQELITIFNQAETSIYDLLVNDSWKRYRSKLVAGL